MKMRQKLQKIPQQKQQRQTLRLLRQSLNKQQQRVASQQLSKRLSQLFSPRPIKNIALYLPFDGEISPLPMLKRWHGMGRHLYLPVVSAGTLRFRRYIPGVSRMHKNRYGIDEPLPAKGHDIQLNQLNLMLIPLVGFDRSGNRMGMGKGYYYRALTRINQSYRRPRLVGLAHACQETALIPNTWDMPMDMIVTDLDVIEITSQTLDQAH